jgi:hypothetical protein
MEFLGWTITDPAKLRNPLDSMVYAINKKGEKLTAETIDSAMRIIRIKIDRDIELDIDEDD